MHFPIYNQFGNSMEVPTMRSKNESLKIEPSKVLSEIDVLKIRKLYGCEPSKYYFIDQTAKF